MTSAIATAICAKQYQDAADQTSDLGMPEAKDVKGTETDDFLDNEKTKGLYNDVDFTLNSDVEKRDNDADANKTKFEGLLYFSLAVLILSAIVLVASFILKYKQSGQINNLLNDQRICNSVLKHAIDFQSIQEVVNGDVALNEDNRAQLARGDAIQGI
jgi:hypothetical protein